MRFVMVADKEFYDQLKKLKDTHEENGNKMTLNEVVEEAVFFLHQINELMSNGYKIAIVDPKGKKHYITKHKKGKKQDDEPRTDEGSNPEDFKG